MRKIIKKGAYIGALLFAFSGVISCEEDFTNIDSGIINNSKFNTKDTILEIEVTQRDIDAVRGDNIATGSIGEFLLGVYQDPNNQYEKIEASIVSQIALSTEIDINSGASSDTILTSVLDNAFIKLPYIATRGSNVDGKPSFTLDSVLGNTTTGVSLKVYRNNTFLNLLNPQNPSKGNSFNSDFDFLKGELLNEDSNFKFIPNPKDTIHEYFRTYNGGTFKDSLELANANPFLVIPLDKGLMNTLFYEKFEDDEFASQDAFNAYFSGIIIEASGDENSLIPFDFSSTLAPSIEINYTTELERLSTGEKDTIRRVASFNLSGVQSRIYKMTPESVSPASNQVIIQGAAGKVADVKILQGNQLDELRAKDWLINDAEITFYIDQDRDKTAIPLRLHLYKKETNFSSQIKDIYSEGIDTFSGTLEKDEEDNNEKYSFKITDYLSDVLGATELKNSDLVLKVFNTTDVPVSFIDTIVTTYNWNPRAVTILNHLPSNGTIKDTRKAQLKISYSEKKN